MPRASGQGADQRPVGHERVDAPLAEHAVRLELEHLASPMDWWSAAASHNGRPAERSCLRVVGHLLGEQARPGSPPTLVHRPFAMCWPPPLGLHMCLLYDELGCIRPRAGVCLVCEPPARRIRVPVRLFGLSCRHDRRSAAVDGRRKHVCAEHRGGDVGFVLEPARHVVAAVTSSWRSARRPDGRSLARVADSRHGVWGPSEWIYKRAACLRKIGRCAQCVLAFVGISSSRRGGLRRDAARAREGKGSGRAARSHTHVVGAMIRCATARQHLALYLTS